MRNVFDEMDMEILGNVVTRAAGRFDITVEEAVDYMFTKDMENMDRQEAFEDFIMGTYFYIKNA
tara:strand:+ start:3085 stop:3276 length:192 start_codon:yes stop_codon:yes gene_type:complete